jgi:hypothetical protein
MVRKLGEYFLANPLYAFLAVLVFTTLPLVSIPGGFLAGILVGFVTLCRGFKTGFLVLIGAAIPVIIITLWKPILLYDLVFLRCALIWVLAGIFRLSISWRLILEILTLLGLVVVLTFHLAIGDVSAWWLPKAEMVIKSVLSGQFTDERIQQMIQQLAPIATGLFCAVTILGAWIQLLLARWWQAVISYPGGLRKEFVEIRAGLILASLFTLTLLAALFGMAFAIDLLPVVILPLVIDGLCLLHKWMQYNHKIVYLLAAVYIGIVILPVIMAVILALLGYIDSWYDLRKRYFSQHSKRGV